MNALFKIKGLKVNIEVEEIELINGVNESALQNIVFDNIPHIEDLVCGILERRDKEKNERDL